MDLMHGHGNDHGPRRATALGVINPPSRGACTQATRTILTQEGAQARGAAGLRHPVGAPAHRPDRGGGSASGGLLDGGGGGGDRRPPRILEATKTVSITGSRGANGGSGRQVQGRRLRLARLPAQPSRSIAPGVACGLGRQKV